MGARASRRRSSSSAIVCLCLPRLPTRAACARAHVRAHPPSRQRGPALAPGRRGVGRRALVWAVLLAVLAVGPRLRAAVRRARVRLLRSRSGSAPALAAVDIGARRGRALAARRTPTARSRAARSRGARRGDAGRARRCWSLPLVAVARQRRSASATATSAPGSAFFALLPVATVLYAAPAGVLAALASRAARARCSRSRFPSLSLVWTLLRLYRDPPVFAFDPFGGYFPGPIYDEALRPPAALLWFRLANLVWIGTAVALALAAAGRGCDPRRWRRGPLAGAAPLVALSVGALRGGRDARVPHRPRAISSASSTARFATEHFVAPLRARRRQDPRRRWRSTGEDLEFRYHQLRETLGVEPKLPDHRVGVPDRGRQEGARRRRHDALREAVDPRDLRAGGPLPVDAPAPRDGARVRGRVRRSDLRHRAGRARWHGPAARAGAGDGPRRRGRRGRRRRRSRRRRHHSRGGARR